MANTSSAKKAIRSSARKKAINDRIRVAYKLARKSFREAVEAGEKTKAAELMQKAVKEIDKAAKKAVIHANTAARYKSRMAVSLSKLA